MSKRTGQCLCGAVKYTAASADNFGVCHCKMCQRWAGSALFGVTVPESDMKIEGEENIGTYNSSSWATRSWCTLCGSPLWYRYNPNNTSGGNYEVTIGTFDDPSGFELKREIFTDV